MIRLTTTETHEYCVAILPKDSFEPELFFSWRWEVRYLLPAINPLTDNYKSDRVVPEGLKAKDQPELLGVIGNGETISEEIAISALYEDYPPYEYDGYNALRVLKNILFENGILVENTIKYPAQKDYGYIESNSFEDEPGWCLEGGEEEFFKALNNWNEAESKLVKAVIIKVKK